MRKFRKRAIDFLSVFKRVLIVTVITSLLMLMGIYAITSVMTWVGNNFSHNWAVVLNSSFFIFLITLFVSVLVYNE